MPSTDGAIGLGLGIRTLLKGPSLKSAKVIAKRVRKPDGASLPSDACTHTAHHNVHAERKRSPPPPRMRNAAKFVVWYAWVVGWPRRSRIDLSCHETHVVSDLTQVSY